MAAALTDNQIRSLAQGANVDPYLMILSGGVYSGHLAANSVTSGNYSSGSIHQFALSSGAVRSGHIVSGGAVPMFIDHSGLINLNQGDPHPQYLLMSGRSGGAVVKGGNQSGELWRLLGTANANPGIIELGSGIVTVREASGGLVGIGTNAPTEQFQVQASGQTLMVYEMFTSGAAGLAAPDLYLRHAGGTAASPLAILSGHALAYLSYGGHDGTAFRVGARMRSTTVAPWGGSERGTQLDLFTIKSGTTSLTAHLTIQFDGSVIFTPASGVVLSGSLASGSVSQFKLASGAVNSGHVASGAVLGQAGGGAFTIASGTIGTNDIGSGAIVSGRLGSGVIGRFHIASGQLAGFELGSGAVVSGRVASGQIGFGHLANASVKSGTIFSGVVGAFHLASGEFGHAIFQSGASITAASYLFPLINEWGPNSILTEENTSGLRAVSLSQSGTIRIAKASVSGTMPAIGFVYIDFLSGIAPDVYTDGLFQFGSGMADFSGYVGRPVYVGRSGHLVTMSGSWNSGGFLSGDIIQQIGVVWNSGGAMMSVHAPASSGGPNSTTSGTVGSGAIGGFFGTRQIASGTVGSMDFGSGAVSSGHIASGQIGRFHHASGQLAGFELGSGAIVSGRVASGQIGFGHLANASVQSGTYASGSIGEFVLASGAVQSGHNNSGNIITYARSCLIDEMITGEIVSGVRAVAIDSNSNLGGIVISHPGSGLRTPAIGVVADNYLSGQLAKVVMMGRINTTAASIGDLSGREGNPVWVGSGGQLVRLATYASGQLAQRIGIIISGGVIVYQWSVSSGAIATPPGNK